MRHLSSTPDNAPAQWSHDENVTFFPFTDQCQFGYKLVVPAYHIKSRPGRTPPAIPRQQ
jgi:hypothetical protein